MTRRTRRREQGAGSIYRRGGGGNWHIAWTDESGRRTSISARTTDKAVAREVLQAKVDEVARVRAGLTDRAALEAQDLAKRSVHEHLEAYLSALRSRDLNRHHLVQKERHLLRFLEAAGVRSLGALTPDRLEGYLATFKERGRSARTQNFVRQTVLAFANWCVRTGRLSSHRLQAVPKREEGRDRRRVRRALTDEELGRLLAVARERGREAWYLAAVLAGLRKGDLKRLTWADVDFAQGRLRIRGGKSRPLEFVPMRPELAEALREHRRGQEPGGDAVFPTVVTDLTRQKDFLRAGLGG